MDLPQPQNVLSAPDAQLIRTFLVDDSPRFLKVVANFLNDAPQLEVIGMALSGREALAQITQLRPDLVLMDLSIPDINGLELTRHLKRQPDAPRIVILTVHADQDYRLAAELVKADGFVTKADIAYELSPLINRLFHLADPTSPPH